MMKRKSPPLRFSTTNTTRFFFNESDQFEHVGMLIFRTSYIDRFVFHVMSCIVPFVTSLTLFL